jgi:TetR/AcrR family transcriptional regulator, ethionamide resistance regulator
MSASSRRTSPPTPRRQALEADVLRATEGLLAGGARFADLAVERIAGEAGLSRTAFYFYFRDKRDLLRRLSEEVTGELFVAADTWWSGAGDLDEALHVFAALYRDHAPLLRAIGEVAAYDDEIGMLWRSLVGRFVTATREHLEAEITAGRCTVPDPSSTAFALVWMTERVMHEAFAAGRADVPQPHCVVRELARIWRAAIG